MSGPPAPSPAHRDPVVGSTTPQRQRAVPLHPDAVIVPSILQTGTAQPPALSPTTSFTLQGTPTHFTASTSSFTASLARQRSIAELSKSVTAIHATSTSSGAAHAALSSTPIILPPALSVVVPDHLLAQMTPEQQERFTRLRDRNATLKKQSHERDVAIDRLTNGVREVAMAAETEEDRMANQLIKRLERLSKQQSQLSTILVTEEKEKTRLESRLHQLEGENDALGRALLDEEHAIRDRLEHQIALAERQRSDIQEKLRREEAVLASISSSMPSRSLTQQRAGGGEHAAPSIGSSSQAAGPVASSASSSSVTVAPPPSAASHGASLPGHASPMPLFTPPALTSTSSQQLDGGVGGAGGRSPSQLAQDSFSSSTSGLAGNSMEVNPPPAPSRPLTTIRPPADAAARANAAAAVAGLLDIVTTGAPPGSPAHGTRGGATGLATPSTSVASRRGSTSSTISATPLAGSGALGGTTSSLTSDRSMLLFLQKEIERLEQCRDESRRRTATHQTKYNELQTRLSSAQKDEERHRIAAGELRQELEKTRRLTKELIASHELMLENIADREVHAAAARAARGAGGVGSAARPVSQMSLSTMGDGNASTAGVGDCPTPTMDSSYTSSVPPSARSLRQP